MKTNQVAPSGSRRDRLIQERVHDPYKAKAKLPEPVVCPGCKALYRAGRWQWSELLPLDAPSELCQACLRTRDNYPAGMITLSGDFAISHKADLIQLVRSVERAEKEEHPLHRVMDIAAHPDRLVIRTTDIHLPRRIADALHHAHKGELEIHYDEDGYLARVNWHRDA